jgi:hypothetical protein
MLLEDQQDCNKLGGECSTSASKAFERLKVGIMTEAHLPPEIREDRLMSTARVIAIASIKKDLKYLEMRSEDSLCRDFDSHDLKVVTEIDLTSHLQAVQQAKSRVSQVNFTPVLAICSKKPSAQISRKSWSKNSLVAKSAVEYVALPCGVKQIARATASAVKLPKELFE